MPDSEVVLRWCRAGLDGLAQAREEIDALNVYPVPDGDTGTNLYLTMEAAWAAANEQSGLGLAEIVKAMARGALIGARGNSGIIVAQMLRGVAEVLGAADVTLADGRALADGLVRAADSAYAAVAEPVEGTILSVARAAGDAARAHAAMPGAALPGVALAAARAARSALERTPEQLAVLHAAGVVDAGGRGLTVLLDAFDTVLTGRRALSAPRRVGEWTVPSPVPVVGAVAGFTGPAYEVMYLLDAADHTIPHLRARLAQLGESLVVVGGDGTWNVHVHVDDAGAALEAGLVAGRPRRINVTYLAADHPEPVTGRAVVAFAAGDGLAELFGSAGATVMPTPIGHRPSTGEVLDAIGRRDVAEVVILPNERDAVPVAEAAAAEARAAGRRVAVIPTVAQVQGLAAVAVHEPGRAFDADVVAMTNAAGHTRHGAVTIAAREAVTMAGICRPGDVLGVIDGDFAIIGTDLLAVATEVVTRMLAAGGELVTVVTGVGGDAALADGVAAVVHDIRPEADTVVYSGGQPRYALLLGVE
ncbi:MAG TPA: DAK2 domain-containing protein [Jiangellaceae bacterium]|nr:DAK2 domain-containing protein [Jiangellaceae bacterium]